MLITLYACAVVAPLGLMLFLAGILADMIAGRDRINPAVIFGLVLWFGSAGAAWLVYDEMQDRFAGRYNSDLTDRSLRLLENLKP